MLAGIAYYLIGATRISDVQRAVYELEVLQLALAGVCLLAVITIVALLVIGVYFLGQGLDILA